MFNQDFFKEYLRQAPLPLAVERTQECILLSKHPFEGPILDLGCGDGIFAQVLFNQKIDVGIDPNKKELQRAKQRNKYKELIECYGNNIPKPDHSFKTIFSNSVMEHIEDIKPVLKETYRLLDKDGRLYLTLPTHLFDHYTLGSQLLTKLGMKKKKTQFSNFFNKFWKHYHYYDAAGWHRLFHEIGFKIEFEQEYGQKKMCLFNDCMTVFSFPSFLSRKFANTWFWSSKWRARYANLLAALFPFNFKQVEAESGKGGLIFFILRKNEH